MLLIHPEVFEAIKQSGKCLEVPAADAKKSSIQNPLFGSLYGMQFLVSRAAVVWSPPQDPFIEYEESDRQWLRAFGYGDWKPGVIEVADGASLLWNFPDYIGSRILDSVVY